MRFGRGQMNRGFTLVEMLVAMGILAVLFSLVTAVVLQSLRIGEEINRRSQLQSDADRLLESMLQHLRNGTESDVHAQDFESDQEVRVCDRGGKWSRFVFRPDTGSVWRGEADAGRHDWKDVRITGTEYRVDDLQFHRDGALVTVTLRLSRAAPRSSRRIRYALTGAARVEQP